jgi:hypothetical protein
MCSDTGLWSSWVIINFLYYPISTRIARSKNLIITHELHKPVSLHIKAKYFFISLFNPSLTCYARLILNSSSTNSKHSCAKKVLVKQSYMFLVWVKKISSTANLGVMLLPKSKKSHFTKLKAPMAHKTFSKEQFIFRHFRFVFSSQIIATKSYMGTSPVSCLALNTLFLLLRLRSIFPKHVTALLFNSKTILSTYGHLNSYAKLVNYNRIVSC